jgi:hypothetical protein
VIGFSKNCPQLTSIEIYGDNFTDDCIVEVSKNCTGLESIDICLYDWVAYVCMNAIANHCHGLKNIKIKNCNNITKQVLLI